MHLVPHIHGSPGFRTTATALFPHFFGPAFAPRDQREGIVVDRQDALGRQELCLLKGVVRSYGEVVADRQDRQSIFLASVSYRQRGRYRRHVDSFRLNVIRNRTAAVAARQNGPVEGERELHWPKGNWCAASKSMPDVAQTHLPCIHVAIYWR
jgi:hypothetical protein